MNQTIVLQKLTPEQRLTQALKLSDFIRELAAKGTYISRLKKLPIKS